LLDHLVPCPVSECNGLYFFENISNDANGIVFTFDEFLCNIVSVLFVVYVFGEVNMLSTRSSFFGKTTNFSFILNLLAESRLSWLLAFVQ